jgi:hypothetical protein
MLLSPSRYTPELWLIVSFQLLKWGKRSLPHVARICLVSTYIDDGIRMWFDWTAQTKYIDIAWNCGSFLATLFVIVNLIGQLAGASLVVAQKHAAPACGLLLFITFLQVNICFPMIWLLVLDCVIYIDCNSCFFMLSTLKTAYQCTLYSIIHFIICFMDCKLFKTILGKPLKVYQFIVSFL